MEQLAKKIGIQIRKYRKEKGLTQACLAEKSNISTDFISRVERGVNIASVHTLSAICESLEIEIAALLQINNELPDKEEFIAIKNLLKNFDKYTLSKVTSVIKALVTVINENQTLKQTKTN